MCIRDSIVTVQDEVKILNMDLVGRKSAEVVLYEARNTVLTVGELIDEANKKHLSTLWSMRSSSGTVNICSNVIEKLRDRIVGRSAAEDIIDPRTGEMIVRVNEEI